MEFVGGERDNYIEPTLFITHNVLLKSHLKKLSRKKSIERERIRIRYHFKIFTSPL